MDATGALPFDNGRGEPQSAEPLPARPAARLDRRWWVMVTIGCVFALGSSAPLVGRAVSGSLPASCQEALRAGDWKRLERLAARWRRWERGKAKPLMYLAEAAYETGQKERAAELLDHLPDADPMTPAALLERSTLLFGPLNRPLEGAETLERVLKLDPNVVLARQRLVYFYAFTLQRQKMVHHAYEAIRRGCDLPETYVYLMAQDWLSFANAYDENTKWLQGNPDEELFLVARTIYRITTKALDADVIRVEQKEGIPYQQKVVAEYFERFPQNQELLAYYLKASSRNGDVEEVARLLSLAPSEAVNDNRFWRYKGWLHAARGELEEAEASYRKALELNCYDCESQHQLAGVFRRLEQPDQVKRFEELGREGKQLQREILVCKSVTTVPRRIFVRMARHAKNCGDDLVADKLTRRLEQQRSGAFATPAAPF